MISILVLVLVLQAQPPVFDSRFVIASICYTYLVATYPVISVSVGLARPKSSIFNSQSSFTAIFEGFKSYNKFLFFICVEYYAESCIRRKYSCFVVKLKTLQVKKIHSSFSFTIVVSEKDQPIYNYIPIFK